ncbi:carboxylesterase/lipase family protein [Tanticharoenia sakaeratensis]|nr:carboxylesterase family protein [Tanticharoenia sakaeratensis]
MKKTCTITALAFVLASLFWAKSSLAASAVPTVSTTAGLLRGVSEGGVDRFMGVPFAIPPTGPQRWMPAAPPDAWHGIRDARIGHEGCVADLSADGPARDNEDCLYLNVWRPAGALENAHLPVVVFFHGGGNTSGETDIYDGARMARAAHAIVVMPAYRYGIMGFLALPDGPDGSLALGDQIAALKWAQANAARFGGDPAHVLLAGESAGAADVCDLLVSPGARGLFQASIMQSTFCRPRPTLETAQAMGRMVAHEVGCDDPGTALRCLRSKPVSALKTAWDRVWTTSEIALPDKSRVPRPLFPVTPVGSALLPRAPMAAIAAGDIAPGPVVIGYDEDELRGFFAGMYPMSSDRFAAIIARDYGPIRQDLDRLYPTAGREPLYVLAAIRSDQMIICPSYQFADAVSKIRPTAMYEFGDRRAPPFRSLALSLPRPPGFDGGASHTSELPYLFGYRARSRNLTPEQDILADRMAQVWVSLVHEPGRWPPYDARTHAVLWISLPGDHSIGPRTTRYAAHHCDFWAQHTDIPNRLFP